MSPSSSSILLEKVDGSSLSASFILLAVEAASCRFANRSETKAAGSRFYDFEATMLDGDIERFPFY